MLSFVSLPVFLVPPFGILAMSKKCLEWLLAPGVNRYLFMQAQRKENFSAPDGHALRPNSTPCPRVFIWMSTKVCLILKWKARKVSRRTDNQMWLSLKNVFVRQWNTVLSDVSMVTVVSLFVSCIDGMPDCVVCMAKKARITLPCGHQCLCFSCTSRVIQEFGTCPLCRLDIDWTEDMLRKKT